MQLFHFVLHLKMYQKDRIIDQDFSVHKMPSAEEVLYYGKDLLYRACSDGVKPTVWRRKIQRDCRLERLIKAESQLPFTHSNAFAMAVFFFLWIPLHLHEMLYIHNHWSLIFPYLQVKYLNVRFERELSEQSAHLEDEQKRQTSLIKQVKQLTIYLFILAMCISPIHTRPVLY